MSRKLELCNWISLFSLSRDLILIFYIQPSFSIWIVSMWKIWPPFFAGGGRGQQINPVFGEGNVWPAQERERERELGFLLVEQSNKLPNAPQNSNGCFLSPCLNHVPRGVRRASILSVCLQDKLQHNTNRLSTHAPPHLVTTHAVETDLF